MPQVFADGARVELDTSITAEDVSLNVIQGGELFPIADYAGVGILPQISPENWFKLVIQDDDGFEVVYCYSHSVGSNTFNNLRRGMDGTTARAFSTGAVVGLRPLAKDMGDLVSRAKTNSELLETKADKTGNIEGNAATATKLESARALSISGGVTAAAKNFDGTMPVDLEVTAIDVSKANAGTLPVARGGTGTTTATGTGKLVLDNSPAFSGTPTAPTAAAGTNNTQVATTGFVANGLSGKSDTNHVHSNATTGSNGFMSSTDKAKLDGIATGATANASDSALRDRSTHTGSQAISTITDLQTTLDSKVAQTDVGSGPSQVPSNQHLGSLAFMDAVGVVHAVQHTPSAIPGTSWKQISGNGFTEKFVDPSGNILDVTPQTVSGALAQMQGFGIGAVTGPVVSDINSLRTGGLYVANSSASAAAGLPLSTLNHTIIHASGSAGSAMQFASPVTTGAGNRWRVWHRQMVADGWSSWRELAFLESPSFTGIPTAPTPAVGTNTTQLQTTAGALAQMKAFGLGQDRFGDVAFGSPKVWPNTISNISPTQFITAEVTDDQSSAGQPVAGGDFSGLSISRGLRPVQLGVNGRGPSAQFWYRGYSAASPIQSEWVRLSEREDGIFTPILEGATTAGSPTYSARFGRYTRIANRVFWTCRITLSSIGGMVGTLRLGGFPFITANAGGAEGSIYVGFYQGIGASAEISGMSGLHRVAASNANIYKNVPSTKNAQALSISDITDSFTIYASGQYEV